MHLKWYTGNELGGNKGVVKKLKWKVKNIKARSRGRSRGIEMEKQETRDGSSSTYSMNNSGYVAEERVKIATTLLCES